LTQLTSFEIDPETSAFLTENRIGVFLLLDFFIKDFAIFYLFWNYGHFIDFLTYKNWGKVHDVYFFTLRL